VNYKSRYMAAHREINQEKVLLEEWTPDPEQKDGTLTLSDLKFIVMHLPRERKMPDARATT
jgi:hypothetical protein